MLFVGDYALLLQSDQHRLEEEPLGGYIMVVSITHGQTMYGLVLTFCFFSLVFYISINTNMLVI